MNTEKMNINVEQGTSELVIRELSSENPQVLPVLEPLKLDICCSITALYAFLEKRWGMEQIDKEHTHIIVDRDNLNVTLVCNENDERKKQVLTAKIQLARQFKGFHINDGYVWRPIDLGNFFRLSRSYFESRESNMSLVTLLKSFSAKVDTTIKREYADNGAITDNYEKAVDSNLPKSFKIRIPIFKGAPAESIEIETIATIEGKVALLQLISSDAECIIEESRYNLINTELEKISKLCPEIPIIEV